MMLFMNFDTRTTETDAQTDANPLRALPSVHAMLEHAALGPLIAERGRELVTGWVRGALAGLRDSICDRDAAVERGDLLEWIAERVLSSARRDDGCRLGRVINATGVILHTGLGRAPLSQSARQALMEVASAGNLEIDLDTGERRHRGYQLQPSWKALTGCDDALAVNNNAAATLLTLQALCAGREVIISRGQLIEIGGSFRLPEIFELSGARLREVGTTNRTRLNDYERAIGPDTAAVMRVHPSNFRIVGFTESPSIADLSALAHRHGLIAIDDIGSGALVDMTKFGLPHEPTFGESLASGADIVLGSGDKLLGGPQAGIILGKSDLVERLRRHPLARTVRIDKLTLAALSATLDSYRRGMAEAEIPTLALLATPVDDLLARASAMQQAVHGAGTLKIDVQQDTAPIGGGSLPGVALPTAVLSLTHADLTADELARRLRLGRIRVCGRIQQDRVLLDLRSVLVADDCAIIDALREIGATA
jgi:L-seryl-tRNA(Ser) seleniumtransferase